MIQAGTSQISPRQRRCSIGNLNNLSEKVFSHSSDFKNRSELNEKLQPRRQELAGDLQCLWFYQSV